MQTSALPRAGLNLPGKFARVRRVKGRGRKRRFRGAPWAAPTLVIGLGFLLWPQALVQAASLAALDAGRPPSFAAIAKKTDARLFEVVPLDDDLERVFRYLVGAS